ncbi:unnamed protein product [Calicophoron daubneyi]|uniref:Uncharacterized protein n=1 Tax=Calicophoron daubneyi TaxID=300641 RepID=A0AAV2TED3_CALDB
MHKTLMGVAASVDRIAENCKHVKESMDSFHTGKRNAAITLPNCSTAPIYTMEQLVALNSKLDDERYNRELISSLHAFPSSSERPAEEYSWWGLANISSQFAKQAYLSISVGGGTLYGKKPPFRF